MSYRTEQDYGKGPRDFLAKTFEQDRVQRDIERAKEDMGEIALFLRTAEEQLERIRRTPLKTFIELRKDKNHGTGHINLTVHVYQLPDIPDAEHLAMKIYQYQSYGTANEKGTMNNPFLGNEKKAAVARALELSEKYGGCPIVGTGAGLVPKQNEIIRV